MSIQFLHSAKDGTTGSGSTCRFRNYETKYPIIYNFMGCDSTTHPTEARIGETITLSITITGSNSHIYMMPRPNKNPISITGADYTYTIANHSSGTLVISNITGPVVINMKAQVRPVTGQLITMTLGNTSVYGTNNLYRVMQLPYNTYHYKVWGPIPVMAMFESAKWENYNTQTGSWPYFGSVVDTSLETDFYNSLTTEAQNAIYPTDSAIGFFGEVAKYNYSSSIFDENTHASYFPTSPTSTTKISTLGIGSRHIFAPEYYYIFEYYWYTRFGSKSFSKAQVQEEFYHNSSGASMGRQGCLFIDSTDQKQFSTDYLQPMVYNEGVINYGLTQIFASTCNLSAKPCFWIDLSKVDWEFVNE